MAAADFGQKAGMPLPKRRHAFLALALLALAGLTLWQWRAPTVSLSSPAPDSVLTALVWRGTTLTLSGQLPAAEPAAAPTADAPTLNLGGSSFKATVTPDGAFTIVANAAPKTPTRALLTVAGTTRELLLVRLLGEWRLLQRKAASAEPTAPYENGAETRGWQPALGFAAEGAGVLALTRDQIGYVAALAKPAATHLYIYGDGLLQAQASTGSSKAPLLALAPETAQVRADYYAASTLVMRARLTIPPTNASARFSLNDGELWLFADLAAQKAETDELLPGQFIPADDDANAPAAGAAATADKAAPAAQNTETR